MATKKASTTSAKKSAVTTETTAETPKPAAKKVAAKKAPAKSAAPENKLPGKTKPPTHAEIAHLAHSYWDHRGRHHGSHESDWLRAEKELNS